MQIFEIELPKEISPSHVVYYLSTTIRNADGIPCPHYFIDSNRATLKKLARGLATDPDQEYWLDWIWRDMPGGKADRKQISTKPWATFSDPKNLTIHNGH